MPARGEIYFVGLQPAKGREQRGKRPVLVVSSDAINTKPLVVTVVVGTSGERVEKDYPSNVRVSAEESGLPKETVFYCFQLRSLDKARFSSAPAGKLSTAKMEEVDRALRLCLDL
jgi:mRNA interferase MazF